MLTDTRIPNIDYWKERVDRQDGGGVVVEAKLFNFLLTLISSEGRK